MRGRLDSGGDERPGRQEALERDGLPRDRVGQDPERDERVASYSRHMVYRLSLAKALFTEVRGIRIQRTSPLVLSRKFAFKEFSDVRSFRPKDRPRNAPGTVVE
jgi:hypothetical protein